MAMASIRMGTLPNPLLSPGELYRLCGRAHPTPSHIQQYRRREQQDNNEQQEQQGTQNVEPLKPREDTPLLSSASKPTSSWSFLWDENYRAPLIAGVGLVILQQISGQPSIVSYVTPIFQEAGLPNNASVYVAGFKLFATLSAAMTVERWGRKRLLYLGCLLMVFALVVLSFTIGTEHYHAIAISYSTSGVHRLLLPAMFLYIGGYQASFGPISWLMISEVFPLRVRGQAVAFALQVNFLLNAVVQFSVPVISDLIGMGMTFGMFGIVTAYRYVPTCET